MSNDIEAERKLFVAKYTEANPILDGGDFMRNGDGCFAAYRLEDKFIGWLLARAALAAPRQAGGQSIDNQPESRTSAEYKVVAAPQQEPVAWLATDLDGHGDVGFTQKIAQHRAGEFCDQFIKLYSELPPPAAPVMSDDEIFNTLYSISDEAISNDEVIASGRRLLAKAQS